MKPILLRFEAFGSYLNEVEIDFSALNDRGLFVISGQTGAGKSTIFDAMTYALYGEGNSKGRDQRGDLRNQLAEPQQPTKVEFHFELKGKKYRIYREFGKKTDACEFQYFKDDTWHAVPVDKQTMTAYNQKIRELIGITVDQFKQIVILPQGEYEEFLTSDSNGKRDILRSIFETEKIVQVVDLLKERLKTMERAILQFTTAKRTIRQQWQTKFSALIHTRTHKLLQHEEVLDESLQEAVDADLTDWRAEEAAKYEQLRELNQQTEVLQQRLQAFISHNQHIDNYERLQRQAHELEQLKPDMEQLRNAAERTRQARELMPAETVMLTTSKQFIDHQQSVERARMELQQLESQTERMQQLATDISLQKENMEALQKTKHDFEQRSDTVNQLESDERTIRALERDLPEWQMQVPRILEQKKRLVEELTLARQNQSVIRYVMQKMLQVEKRRNSKLARLASSGRETLETAKEIYTEWVQSYTDDLEQYGLAGIWTTPELIRYLENHSEDHDDSLQRKSQTAIMEKELQVAEENLARLTEQIAAGSIDLDNKRNAYQNSIRLLASLLDSNQPSVKVYYEKKLDLDKKISKRTVEIQQKELTLQQWNVKWESQKQIVSTLASQSDDYRLKAESAKSAFEAERERFMFHEAEEYHLAKAHVHALDQWFAKLAAYETRIERTKKEILQLEELLNGMHERKDTSELTREVQQLREREQKQAAELGAIQTEIKNLQYEYKQYGQQVEQSKAQEAELIPAKELKEVLEGGNKQISFENHILMYHFREILHFANQRLYRMVDHRYQLKLNEAVSKNKEALELHVFDHQTGLARPVYTLSGGEKFMASLALGLGAADSIHASRGGIEMNMMFIDEGFGTLDPEKLEEAVRVLLEISKGRVIGVISHRSELKERMPAMIEVVNRDGISDLRVRIRD